MPITSTQKLKEHGESKEHKHVVQLASAAEGGASQASVTGDIKLYGTVSTEDERYYVTIRTVHAIAVQQLGLTKMMALIELQLANGVVLSYSHAHRGGEGGGLEDWLLCGRKVFERLMRERARNSVSAAIFPDGVAFGSLGDGSNDRSNHEQEASVLRFIGPDGLPYNTLHDLLPLDLTQSVDGRSPDAACIHAAYKEGYEALEAHEGFLRYGSWVRSIVASSWDGASVMSGEKGGVAAKMKVDAPHHLSVHAVAHVHQLALGEAFQLVEYYAVWRDVLQEVYVYYHKSGKKRFTLEQIAAELDTELLTLKGIHGIRWAASLEQAIKALLESLPAIAADLESTAKSEAGIELGLLSPSEVFLRKTFWHTFDAAEGGRRTRRYKAVVDKIAEPRPPNPANDRFVVKYSDGSSLEMSKSELVGILTVETDKLAADERWQLRSKLTSKRFVGFSCFMLDVYSQLAILSKACQGNSLIISDLVKDVRKTVRLLKKLQTTAGEKEAWFKAECDKDEGANTLSTCRLQVEDGDEEAFAADKKNILEHLVTHIESRYSKVLDNPILQSFAVFDHRHWPTEHEALEAFGKAEINELYKHYKDFFPDTTLEGLLDTWIDLKEEISKSPGLKQRPFKSLWSHMLVTFSGEYMSVLRLVAIMLLIPLDTSEAERIFSLMNDIKTSERSRLGQRNLANLMFWHYHGRNMKAWEVPVQEILKEFHELVKGSKRGRQAHPAAAPIKYAFPLAED